MRSGYSWCSSHERLRSCNGDAELLGELPPQRIRRRFPGTDLATRKFPQAIEGSVAQTFGNQDAPRRIAQNAGRDVKVVHEVRLF